MKPRKRNLYKKTPAAYKLDRAARTFQKITGKIGGGR